MYSLYILNAIGDIYFLKKDYKKAAEYYNDARLASTAQKNLKDQGDALLNIAKLRRTTGAFDSSLYYSRKALTKSRLFGVPSGIKRAYNSLFLDYKLLKHTDSAFTYLQLTKSLGDSLARQELVKTNQYQA